ncbi:glycosyltransferase family 4 protein [Rufibacter latericius]|uniref:Glycosyltransferase family 1 protein n=1 Tax=Rufibacter latericius TaxID=2487040 RepID=A0A3M9MAB6_9BACT|nr:glycosyltransferase family 1 protein [Rufibacter latericius]RNI22456.1 glycosyltransferase family 1 protein [Rufibacter latericius]
MPSLVVDARMIHASGIGVYLKQLLPFLPPYFKVSVIGKAEELNAFEWSSEVTILPMEASIYSIKEQLALTARIPTCDIFWSPQYNIPVLPIRAKKRLVTIHDTYHLAYRHTLGFAQKVYATILMRAAIRLSDQVVTVSHFSEKELVRYTGCPSEKINIIYNGVDLTRFKPDFSETGLKELRAALPQLPDNYLLYVGNVKPHKNLITLLKAYNGLPFAIKERHHLVIVGQKQGFITPDQEAPRYLEEQKALQPFVHFTGFVPDNLLPFLYKYASLSVFPSLYEGFGMPPLESMACGCPVVASTSASIPEVCGEAALYFDALDVKGLQKQLERVLTEDGLRAELRVKGLQHCQKYSWRVSAEYHLGVLQKLLSTP